MLSMKVSTLRCSYLNKSNRVGLVPRGLHYRTKHGYEKGKSSREDRIFKVGVEKSSGREREGERGRKERSIYFTRKDATERLASILLGETSPRATLSFVAWKSYELLVFATKSHAIRAGNRSLDTGDDGSIFIRKWKGVNAGQRTRLGKQVKLVRKLNQSLRLYVNSTSSSTTLQEIRNLFVSVILSTAMRGYSIQR